MTETCGICRLVHPPGPTLYEEAIEHCMAAQREAMRKLLKLIAGAPVKCGGCPAMVYWVTHKNGKRTPYTAAGLNHFLTCPEAERFRRGKT